VETVVTLEIQVTVEIVVAAEEEEIVVAAEEEEIAVSRLLPNRSLRILTIGF
jgi:hypothetical protein